MKKTETLNFEQLSIVNHLFGTIKRANATTTGAIDYWLMKNEMEIVREWDKYIDLEKEVLCRHVETTEYEGATYLHYIGKDESDILLYFNGSMYKLKDGKPVWFCDANKELFWEGEPDDDGNTKKNRYKFLYQENKTDETFADEINLERSNFTATLTPWVLSISNFDTLKVDWSKVGEMATTMRELLYDKFVG